MSETVSSLRTTAAIHGRRWSERAADWARLAAGVSAPAWEAVAEAVGIAAGTRVLDVGCGSGEFCALAAGRGAAASGIDAAEGMIEVARGRVRGVDFLVGPMESLPWEDDTFDVVTGFNAFQFAADFVGALVEAKRVARPGGSVAICNWGRPQESQLFAITGAVRPLQPPPPPGTAAPDTPATGEPGVLEGLARAAELDLVQAGEIDVPLEAPDRETLALGLMAPGGFAPAIRHSGERAVRRTIAAAAAPFRRHDGSYRFENRFRYVICAA